MQLITTVIKAREGVLEYAVKEKYSGPHDDKEGGRNCSWEAGENEVFAPSCNWWRGVCVGGGWVCVCSFTRIPAGHLTRMYTRSTASFKVWVLGVWCCSHRSPFLPHDPLTSYSPSGEGLRERSHLEDSICQTPLALKSISDKRGQNNC